MYVKEQGEGEHSMEEEGEGKLSDRTLSQYTSACSCGARVSRQTLLCKTSRRLRRTPRPLGTPDACTVMAHLTDRVPNSILTDEHLNVLMKDTGTPNPDVWAIGDAAIIKGNPLPATAQGELPSPVHARWPGGADVRGV